MTAAPRPAVLVVSAAREPGRRLRRLLREHGLAAHVAAPSEPARAACDAFDGAPTALINAEPAGRRLGGDASDDITGSALVDRTRQLTRAFAERLPTGDLPHAGTACALHLLDAADGVGAAAHVELVRELALELAPRVRVNAVALAADLDADAGVPAADLDRAVLYLLRAGAVTGETVRLGPWRRIQSTGPASSREKRAAAAARGRKPHAHQ